MLTKRQYQVLDFIEDVSNRLGWSPTIREIMEQVGLKSTSTISYQIGQLVDRGYIDRGPKGHPRMLAVTEAGKDAMREYLDG